MNKRLLSSFVLLSMLLAAVSGCSKTAESENAVTDADTTAATSLSSVSESESESESETSVSETEATTTTTSATTADTAPLTGPQVGEEIQMGDFHGKMDWIVLRRQGDLAYVISKYVLIDMHFDEYTNQWEDSGIRKWLNGEFYEKSFTDDEKSRFVSTGGDKVTLLTLGEAKSFDKKILLGLPTQYAKKHGLAWDFTSGGSSYWLKTLDPERSVYVTWVDFEGLVHDNGYTVWADRVIGVRPVMWVKVAE